MDGEQTSRRRIILPLAILVLLGLGLAVFLPSYVNANRWRPRLEQNLSAALGRPVKIGSAQIEILPLPAFVLNGFTVSSREGAAAEPVLHAETVTARVRLLPLLRRRIEVARISLDDASLNLERSADGKWNFESLLETTPQLPAGPTTQHRAAGRFPYVEVSGGRINLKRGTEKLPVSLTDADLAFWLESPGEWRLRLRATPQRTDIPNSGIGEVRIEGSIQRVHAGDANGWRDAGIHLTGEWREVPLGQLSRAIYGEDLGWRGIGRADLTLAGRLTEAETTVRTRIDGLRRADFVPETPLDLDMRCGGQVAVFAHEASSVACTLPAGGGTLLARGGGRWGAMQERALQIDLSAQAVPAEWVLDGVRVLRHGISPELRAEGSWSGNFTWNAPLSPGATHHVSGNAQWTGGVLHAPQMSEPITLPVVSLSSGAEPTAQPTRRAAATRSRRKLAPARATAQPAAVLPALPLATAAFPVSLGGDSPLSVTAGFSREGYAFALNGGADAGRLATLARLLGIAHMHGIRTATGDVSAHLVVNGTWQQGLPLAAGTVALSRVTLQTAWLPGPITAAQATLAWDSDGMRVANAQAVWGRATWQLSATHALSCETPPCAWQVQAHTSAADASQLANAFRNGNGPRLLEMFQSGERSGLPPTHVIADADILTLGGAVLHHAAVDAQAGGTVVTLPVVHATLFGAPLEGSGTWDFGASRAEFHLGMTAANIAQAGAPFHEQWGRGTAECMATLNFAGLDSLSGEWSAMLRSGALLGVGIAGTPLAKFDTWQMSGTLGGNRLSIARSSLNSGGATQEVTGSIGFDRSLDLTARPVNAPNAPSTHITGKLGAPPAAKGTTP